MSMWIAVLGVGLGSLVLRVLPLLVVGHLRLTAEQEAFLGRAGLAAIAALIAVSARSAAVESSALAPNETELAAPKTKANANAARITIPSRLAAAPRAPPARASPTSRAASRYD